MNRDAENVRDRLDAPDFKSILIWRLAAHGGPTETIPVENARAAAGYAAARYGAHDIRVTEAEFEALRSAGATVMSPPETPSLI